MAKKYNLNTGSKLKRSNSGCSPKVDVEEAATCNIFPLVIPLLYCGNVLGCRGQKGLVHTGDLIGAVAAKLCSSLNVAFYPYHTFHVSLDDEVRQVFMQGK